MVQDFAGLDDLGNTGRKQYCAQERVAIDQELSQAAYFSLFSVPNPESPTKGVPLVPFIPLVAVAFKVNEGLHHFEALAAKPDAVCGFHVSKSITEDLVARVKMDMVPMPNNFEPAPDRVPPPTVLLPFISQRFAAMNGELEFADSAGSGFRAFGAGRTFPVIVAGSQQTLLTGILDIVEGFGKFKGMCGTGVVSGDVEPPAGFHFNAMFRIVDPKGSLHSTLPLPPLQMGRDPEPEVAFIPLIAEPDPDQPMKTQLSKDGKHVMVHMAELLRIATLSFDSSPATGIQSQTVTGDIVGRHTCTLVMDANIPGTIHPGFSVGGEFSFFDGDGGSIGGFKADLFEARFFQTALQGTPGSFFRIGGMAPPREGTGQFTDCVGMVAVNGAFSPITGALSIMYVIRLSDPYGHFNLNINLKK